jgi:hypothetical protein
MIRDAHWYATAIGDRSSGGVVTGTARSACVEPEANLGPSPNTWDSGDLREPAWRAKIAVSRRIRYRIWQSKPPWLEVSTPRSAICAFFHKVVLETPLALASKEFRAAPMISMVDDFVAIFKLFC